MKHNRGHRARARRTIFVAAVLLPGFQLLAQSTGRTYVNPVHHWSITVPPRWSIDSQDVAFVQLKPPPGSPEGLVGIHAGQVRFQTADELVDFSVAYQSRSGQGINVVARRVVYLPDSVRAVELESRLGVGTVGHSLRRYVIKDGIAYVLDAETYDQAWPTMGPSFVGILRSFRIGATGRDSPRR